MLHSSPRLYRREAKTVSHPLTCPDSRKWSASLLLGCVWSWLLPTDGVLLKHPRRCKFVFFSSSLPAHCPSQCNLMTTRSQVLSSFSWAGPQSLSLYFHLFLRSSPQPESVCTNPYPTPLVAQHLSFHSQHGPSSSRSSQPPSICSINPVPCLCLPSLPLGGPLSPTPSLLVRVWEEKEFLLPFILRAASKRSWRTRCKVWKKNKAWACQKGPNGYFNHVEQPPFDGKFSTPTPVAIKGTLTLFYPWVPGVTL